VRKVTVKAIVFDLDGTITSFNVDYKVVRAEVKSLFVANGLPSSILSMNESIFDMFKEVEIFLRNNGESEKKMEKLRSNALKIAEKHEYEAAKNTSLLPGASETLKSAKNMNLRIGLCTINSEKATDYILKRFKIADLFDAVITREKVKHVKPNPEHLQAALNALEVKSDEVIFVGDGSRDMLCARELGVLAVGLATGISTGKELTVSGANYIITSITDLPSLIERLSKP
jgi:HAD superfamily hydrolase (TIGR01549 family)